MFVCKFHHNDNAVFGSGDTLLESFHDMLEMAGECWSMEYVESIGPHDCEFFEQIEVDIQANTTWIIEPQY